MDRQTPHSNRFTDYIGHTIFISRWLQAPLYLGLVVAQGVYVWHFMKELVHLVADGGAMTETGIMLVVLGLVDVVMIANLLIMVIIGGYETFVSKIRIEEHPDQPEWLSHVNANVLKVKLAMAIIGISSIHLLKTFIDANEMEPEAMMWQTIIHLAFVVSAIALAYIDWLSQRSHGHAGSPDLAHGPQPPDPVAPASAPVAPAPPAHAAPHGAPAHVTGPVHASTGPQPDAA